MAGDAVIRYTFLYSEDVKLKEEAGIDFCKTHNWKYQIVEIAALNKLKIIFPMRQRDEITLTPHWEKQYQVWLEVKGK